MAKRRPSTVNGFVVVDKPAGMTSHDVVQALRNTFRERRVGHSGTLDPDATGVLIVGIGTATRLLRFLGTFEKSYVGEVVLGTATSTLDSSGTVTAQFDMGHVRLEDVRAEAVKFRGSIDQLPPMVSAVRVGGKRLYKLARSDQDVEVERPTRRVEVHRLEIDATNEPHVFQLTVDCSSGTYVRSLAADLGTALGGGAHLRCLRRTGIGSFRVEEAVRLDGVQIADVHPISEMAAHLDSIRIDAERREEVAHGVVFDCAALGATGDGPWACVDPGGELLAVYEPWRGGRMKPAVVLVAPDDATHESTPRDQ